MNIDLHSAEIGAVLATESDPARTAEELARYAHASGDLNPLHLDRDFARQAGFDELVVHGMLNMARLGLLREHFPAESIRSFGARFEGVLTVGEPTRVVMRLAGREDALAELSLDMLTQDGRRIVSGRASVGFY